MDQVARTPSTAALRRLLGSWRADADAGGENIAYRALAESLRRLVLDGRIPLHTRLPAERELAAALGVSRTTIAAAYELLRGEGFLTSRRGSGSFTALPAGRPMPSAGLSPFPTDGGGVIDLGVAAMSAPEPWISRSMAAAVAELPQYTATHGDFPAGLRVLREAVARRYTERGVPTSAEQVLITNGASSALGLLLREFVSPGTRIAVDSPSYVNALQALRLAGTRPLPVPLLEDGWSVESWADTLRAAAPALAYLIPDFHNPTGLVMSDPQRHELVRLARATGTLLIADETTAELSLDPGASTPLPLAAHDRAGAGSTVISLGSAGKTFWGGLRIGWLRGTAELVRKLAADRSSADVASPVVEQLAVRHLLSDGVFEEVLAHQRTRVRAQRDALVGAVRERLPEWTFRVPEGGLALWVRTAGESATALASVAEGYGLWIAAGPRFGVEGVLEGFLRLPFSQPAEAVEEAVRRLAAAREALRTGAASSALPGAPAGEPAARALAPVAVL